MNDKKKVYTVTEITNEIKNLIERHPILNRVWLKGEVSNFKHHSSGHMYFSLKDEGASIAGVMFTANNRSLNFKPNDGMKVIVYGMITVYPPTGRYQIRVQVMQPEGWGKLHLEFLALKEKLSKEGLFDIAHKKELPGFPHRIGIVTSPTGAAIRDMITVLKRRYPLAEVILYPALCQGPDAPPSLIKGLKYLETFGVDVIIIGRGGGSMEDLWAFNDEILARTVFNLETPVISAVGHEIDFTICDFVADKRAATPTEAAEIAVPDSSLLLDQCYGFQNRILSSVKSFQERYKRQLEIFEKTLKYYHPRNYLDRFLQTIDSYQSRIIVRIKERLANYSRVSIMVLKHLSANTPTRLLERRKSSVIDLFHRLALAENKKLQIYNHYLKAVNDKLNALSPCAVLERGYSITLDKNGKTLKSASDVLLGDKIDVLLHKGRIGCLVDIINKGEDNE